MNVFQRASRRGKKSACLPNLVQSCRVNFGTPHPWKRRGSVRPQQGCLSCTHMCSSATAKNRRAIHRAEARSYHFLERQNNNPLSHRSGLLRAGTKQRTSYAFPPTKNAANLENGRGTRRGFTIFPLRQRGRGGPGKDSKSSEKEVSVRVPCCKLLLCLIRFLLCPRDLTAMLLCP